LSIQDTDEGVGVKVLDVDDESNAAKAGIKEGDIIVGIDDHEIKGTDDVTKTIREAKDKYNFNFKINRDGKTQTIKVNMPRKLKTADL
jgi:serine protease Do